MRRRRKPAEHANHERWLVSYADFITLLFAFFVVMFASSQADRGRAAQVSDSVKKAFGENRVKAAVASVLGGTPDDAGLGNGQMKGPGGARQDLTEAMKQLKQDLAAELQRGQIELRMEGRGLVVSFQQAILFPSASDVLGEEAVEPIAKVAKAILKLPYPIRLEGHTDSLPIHNERFHSNWELSAARSIALLEFLVEIDGIDRSRMSISGYADVAPVDTNDTEEGRARNRRVDLVILNESGAAAQPSKRPSVPRPTQTSVNEK